VLPELALALFHSFIDPDALDLIADLLSISVVVVLLMPSSSKRKEHQVLITCLVVRGLGREHPRGVIFALL
jgi:hypothetical protein